MQIGSRVVATDHEHLPPMLIPGNVYNVIAVVPEAGVLCLEEFGRRKTFPTHWFRELDIHE